LPHFSATKFIGGVLTATCIFDSGEMRQLLPKLCS
jgi:hypothetical protein